MSTARSATPGTLPASEVKAMFDRIAGRYDLLNRVMTVGLDQRWRETAAAAADVAAGDAALDVCCGTGDLAMALARRVTSSGRVVGLDFAENMLEIARRKAADEGLDVTYIHGDALALPFSDNEFAAATVGFGIRNVSDLAGALREMTRVVRPGGRVAILEITIPARLQLFFGAWFDRLVPVMGRVLAGDADAYRYLPASVKRFPQPRALAGMMVDAGLEDVRWQLLARGIVALHYGRVPR